MLTSVNCSLNANIGVDYEKLDIQISNISERWEKEDVEIVLYDSDSYRIEVSPLIVYSELEVIPVTQDKLKEVCLYLNEKGINLEKCRVLLSEEIYNNATIVEIYYERQAETFGEVPKERYSSYTQFYEYPLSQILQ